MRIRSNEQGLISLRFVQRHGYAQHINAAELAGLVAHPRSCGVAGVRSLFGILCI
jgi:hypothetical protein